jgi:iron complex outermembrane recepter protein
MQMGRATSSRPVFTCVTASILIAGAVPGAHADEGLEEVVVTAQKREENLQRVPIAISAFTAAALENVSITDSTKLQQLTPGLNFGNAGAFSQFYIRGIGNSNATAAAESPTAIYVDGVYYSDISSVVLTMQNVERVEILKGPQGTLYGRNATAGAINIITKSPVSGFDADAKVSAGNFGYGAFSGYVNGGTDTLMANLAVSKERRDGTFNNLFTGRALNDLDRWSMRGKLRWVPNDTVDLTLALDYTWEDDTQTTGYQSVSPVTPGTVGTGELFGGRTSDRPLSGYVDYPAVHYATQKGAALTGRFHLDGVDIVSISAYRKFNVVATQDIDGTDANVGGYITYDFHDQVTQEVQFLSTGSGKLKWVGGIYFLHDRTGFDPLDYFAFIQIPIVGKVAGTSYAGFGEVTYALSDELSLTAGARYNQEEKHLYEISLFGAQFPTDAHTWNPVTWRGTLSWQRPEGLYYFTASKGFKAGTYNIGSPNPVANKPVDPETLVAYEAGAKWSVGSRLHLNVAGFHYDYKNLQVEIFGTESASTILQNAASANVNGAEAELQTALWRGLSIRAGASYLDSTYGRFPDASVLIPNPSQSLTNPSTFVGAAADLSGRSTPRAPKFTSTLGFDWAFELAGRGTLDFSGNWYHSNRYTLDIGGSLVAPSYSLLSANVAYHSPDDRWSISVWGNNLADDRYFPAGADVAVGRVVAYADPRMFGVTATVRMNPR